MSPVGRPDEMQDGKPARVYRGAPNPLGVATEWVCPSCRGKNEGRRIEEGCGICGVGVPDPNAKPIQEPQRSEPSAPDHRVQQRAERPAAAPSRPTETVRTVDPAPLVVTRIVQYLCYPGHEAAMEHTLQRSLVGRTQFVWGEIVAAIVDDVSSRQQDILGLAQRQPGVWLGGPESDQGFKPVDRRGGWTEYRSPSGGKKLVRDDDARDRAVQQPIPNTGPAFTDQQRVLAGQLTHLLGYKGAYTLALALQNYAELAAAESMEPEKIYTRDECLQLANALMTLIPEDWEPEPAVELPPGGPEL